jgi:predicted methyltransferase
VPHLLHRSLFPLLATTVLAGACLVARSSSRVDARPAAAPIGAAAASHASSSPAAASRAPSSSAAAPTPLGAQHLYEATSRRSFSDVPYWASVFDDPARDTWQKPRELVAALGLTPGTWVADLGAGTGYFARYLATAVGPAGVVFAVETEPNMVQHLRERAEKERTPNLIPVLASFDDARLPPGAIDLVLIVDTFHHIDQRLAYLERLARVLKPGGRVAIIDWRKENLPVGPPPDHKIARAQVIDEMAGAGYSLVAEPDVLPYQYFLIFTLRERARDPTR